MAFLAQTSASREVMAREKRPLVRDATRVDGMPEEKRQRPALASVIVEAVKMDSLQKLCSTLEPLLRRVVGEEVERALAKFVPPKPGFRPSPKRIQGPDQRDLRLQFRNKLALPLFTGSKVEGEQGTAIHVVLLDASTNQVITSGPESCAKLDIVVVEGDFAVDDEDNWSQAEFENAEVRERDGKRPLLTGELSVTLKDGVGTLGDLTFTDNSSWIRSRKFRLAVKISSGNCEGLRIREAKTDAFTVKDHRGELYKKHYPPALHDDVWRLDKIGKDGAFHKRLNQANIMTVEDFLRLVVMDPQRLRNTLGTGMSNKMWEGTVEHAKTCVLSGKLHVYYADEKQNIGVIFNNIFQLMGLIAEGSYMSVDSLSDSEKVYVDKLVKVAYENWENVVEYDGEALVGVTPYPAVKGMDIHTEDPISAPILSPLPLQSESTSQQSKTYQSQQPALTSVQHRSSTSSTGSRAAMPPYGPTSLVTQAYGESTQLPDPKENSLMGSGLQMNSNIESRQQSAVSSSSQQSYVGNSGMTGLALGPPQSDLTTSSPAFLALAPGIMNASSGGMEWQSQVQENYAQGLMVEELPTEDELRARSLEFLENEDMHTQIQQLLRMFNTGEGSFTGEDINFPGSQVGVPTVTSQETRANGKAFVGWLKLKAALRWGIFVRKQAAARRAQLEEVEDE